MRHLKQIFILVVLNFLLSSVLFSQIKGEPPAPKPKFNPDTIFVFNSPRPLINVEKEPENLKNSWGIDLLFSNNGFGAGFFLQKKFSDDLSIFGSIYFSGARNTDEFEVYIPLDSLGINWTTTVPGKINRLYMFPVTFGLQKYFFRNLISETLRPYANIGFGPTIILATPYSREFFNAFGYGRFFIRFGSFLGVGADVGTLGKALMAVNIRYYYIPFGGNGIESVINHPLKDFGGLFLSLSIGTRY
jgi:hypothetical protein